MKRKTLFIILLIPFIVAILGFVNVVIIKNYVEVDIAGINWNYDETTGFKISDNPYEYKLEAEPIFDESLMLSAGNDLKWTMNEEDQAKGICEILTKPIADGKKDYYLKTIDEGSVTLTCSNEKGNVSRNFNAVIYKNGTIVVNPILVGNGESISGKRAFGEYDISYKDLDSKIVKEKSRIEFKIDVLPSDSSQDVQVVAKSDFISLAADGKSITFNSSEFGNGDAFISFEATNNPFIKGTYKFRVIKDGINVYNYNDLLMCTNKSNLGEIVCLQTNLECLENTYKKDKKGNYIDEYLKLNTKLFGNFNFKTQKTSFKDEVYVFDTDYDDRYIKQYCKNDVTTQNDILTGIRVQKDFYGNGFVINGRELTYPTVMPNGESIDKYTGKLTPSAKNGDLFLGPLTFVSIGKFDAPIMKAFGQDNSLMYVDGNGIVLDDLNLMNTHKFDDAFGPTKGQNNIYNLEYTGTCVDVKGVDVTLQNSRLQNARTILRVYDSDGFLLKNSILEKAREFLMKIGNNKIYDSLTDDDIEMKFGKDSYKGTFDNFMKDAKNLMEGQTTNADKILIEAFFKPNSENPVDYKEKYKVLNEIQQHLDKTATIQGDIPEITVEDTYFYRSGIFAIAFDTYFNGPYLYNGLPSLVKQGFDILGEEIILPNKISGVMKPTNLTIKGDTKFYDWKGISTVDASCLIEERLGSLLGSIVGDDKMSIDDYFPMKYALDKQSKSLNYNYTLEDKDESYLNTPIAWYGGGTNLSTVNFENVKTKDFGEPLYVDLTQMSLMGEGYPTDNALASLLGKCVPVAAGFSPFKFITNSTHEGTPYLFGEVPQIEDLKTRALKEA